MHVTEYTWPHRMILRRIEDALRPIEKTERELTGVANVDLSVWAEACPETARVVYRDGDPVFVFGAVPIIPGVSQLWGYGTQRANRIIPQLGRYIIDRYGPELFELHGVRRVQVHVPIKCEASWSWLMRLGMRLETSMHGFCVDGSSMLQLAYTQEDYKNHVLHEATARRARKDHSREDCVGCPA